MFQPGQSGNPGGRHRDKPITAAYRSLHTRKVPVTIEKMADGKDCFAMPNLREYFSELLDENGRLTLAQLTALRVFINASQGDLDAAQEVSNRLDGKVPQAIVGGDDDSAPIRLITNSDADIIARYQALTKQSDEMTPKQYEEAKKK